MGENEKENQKNSKFITVNDTNKYNEKKVKNKSGFGKTVLLPFFSGVVGCALVIGTCFGIPSIRSAIMNDSEGSLSNTSNNSNESSGYVSQIALSNYSDTAVYAANKILPSIVGIKVEYTVNNPMLAMFGQNSTSSATATGSGIIIRKGGFVF